MNLVKTLFVKMFFALFCFFRLLFFDDARTSNNIPFVVISCNNLSFIDRPIICKTVKYIDKLDNSSLRVLGLILKDLVGSSLISRLTICYIVAVSFIGGGNRGKPPICHKSLTNFIT